MKVIVAVQSGTPLRPLRVHLGPGPFFIRKGPNFVSFFALKRPKTRNIFRLLPRDFAAFAHSKTKFTENPPPKRGKLKSISDKSTCEWNRNPLRINLHNNDFTRLSSHLDKNWGHFFLLVLPYIFRQLKVKLSRFLSNMPGFCANLL